MERLERFLKNGVVVFGNGTSSEDTVLFHNPSGCNDNFNQLRYGAVNRRGSFFNSSHVSFYEDSGGEIGQDYIIVEEMPAVVL